MKILYYRWGDKCEYYMANDEERNSIIQLGRNVIRQNFNLDKQLDVILNTVDGEL